MLKIVASEFLKAGVVGDGSNSSDSNGNKGREGTVVDNSDGGVLS